MLSQKLPTEELIYVSSTGKRHPFESTLESEASVYLSIIIPAYNEEARLPIMMNKTLAYLETRKTKSSEFTYELLIVDDASQDHTYDIAVAIASQNPDHNIRVLRSVQNHGKGGAIRKGVLRCRGRYILFVDADGATEITDFDKLERSIHQIEQTSDLGLVMGSRAHLEDEAKATRHVLRNTLMHGFHLIVSTLCVQTIRDTQCGFKLFNRDTARILFPPLHIERWAFDVELLYLAEKLGIPMHEIAVEWREIQGSKLNVVDASLTMLRELVLIRLCYASGLWKWTDGHFRLEVLQQQINALHH